MYQALEKSHELIAALASSGDAWGNLGHHTVALLAQKNLTIEGKCYADNLLGSMAYDDAAVYRTAPLVLAPAAGTSWTLWTTQLQLAMSPTHEIAKQPAPVSSQP